ncbi:hypothetical protein [Streptomyces caelestis]|uniref:hypothetical protein n=1 Tax=Streptomyces caelestis TaxID=36816 RepID=UPI003662D7BB
MNEFMYWLIISITTLRLSIVVVQSVTEVTLARIAARRDIQMRRTEGDVLVETITALQRQQLALYEERPEGGRIVVVPQNTAVASLAARPGS